MTDAKEDSNTVDDATEIPKSEDKETKEERKERKRHKKLIKAIQTQLEFYFGDANLRHDRFLRTEIVNSNEGFIPIATMMSFNKLKQMVGDNIGFVAKAAKNSMLLEVGEQEKSIRRNTPVPGMQNTDAQTVYVEHLPADANHDWLHNVFATCGKVEYISLPRFKHTGEIKGFAFIEYSTAEDAEKACRVLNTLYASKDKHKEAEEYGQTIPVGNTEGSTEETKTRKTSITENQDTESLAGSSSSVGLSPLKDIKRAGKRRRCLSESESSEQVDKMQKKRKRRKSVSESSSDLDKCRSSVDCGNTTSKGKRKWRAESICSESEDDKTGSRIRDRLPSDLGSRDDSVCNEPKNKLSKMSETNNETELLKPGTNTTTVVEPESNCKTHKKKRKRNKKLKEKVEIHIPPLYVISKSEWMTMKKKYKSMQKLEVNILKGHLHADKSQKKNVPPMNGDVSELKGPVIPVSNGTVLRLTATNSGLSRKAIKEMLVSSTVAYIDFKEGANEGYIRFHSREGASHAVEKQEKDGRAFSLSQLTAGEEAAYFDKIDADRKAKYDKKQSGNKKERGIEKVKVKKKIEKVKKQQEQELIAKKQHIFFPDER